MLCCAVGVALWIREPAGRTLPITLFCAIVLAQNLWIIPLIRSFYHR